MQVPVSSLSVKVKVILLQYYGYEGRGAQTLSVEEYIKSAAQT